MNYEKMTKTEVTDLIVAEYKAKKIEEATKEARKAFEAVWDAKEKELYQRHDAERIALMKEKSDAEKLL